MPEPLQVDIAVLLYGDYPELASRCLKPLVVLREAGVAVRVYANAPSPRTLAVVDSLGFRPKVFDPQIYKYPVMRAAIREAQSPLFMWFDDDSCVIAQSPLAWLNKVRSVFRADVSVIGGIYFPSLFTEQQKAWAQSRYWFRGRPISSKPKFVTGGWWTARVSTLLALDWPDPQLRHRGGDVALGVACAQHGFKLANFREGVAINADAALKESASRRRGYDEPSAGAKGWKPHEEETHQIGGDGEVP